jgi:hypothetical protein
MALLPFAPPAFNVTLTLSWRVSDHLYIRRRIEITWAWQSVIACWDRA